MRFTDSLGRPERSELSQMEAAGLLEISERTFRRCRDRHLGTEFAGLDDRRLAPSLVDEEGTASSMRGVAEVLVAHGSDAVRPP
ncbi:MAG: hypothetical protein ABSC06_19210 [Rhodopila sp.]|jgi:hypothetical protein